MLNLIFLNRALGGGWSLDDPVPDEVVAEGDAPRDANPQGGSS